MRLSISFNEAYGNVPAAIEIIPSEGTISVGDQTEHVYMVSEKLVVQLPLRQRFAFVYLKGAHGVVETIRSGETNKNVTLSGTTASRLSLTYTGHEVTFTATPIVHGSALPTEASLPRDVPRGTFAEGGTETYRLVQTQAEAIQAINGSVSALLTMMQRLEVLPSHVQQIWDRLSRLSHYVSTEVPALHEQLQRIQTPPPPVERSFIRQIPAWQALFDALSLRADRVGYQGRLDFQTRAVLAQHLRSLREESGRWLPEAQRSELSKLNALADLLGGDDAERRFRQAVDRGDTEAALQALTRLAEESGQGESLDDERIEALVTGFATVLWEGARDEVLQPESVLRRRLDDALHCLGIQLLLPFDEPYDANRHRIGGREPARPGEPINQVIAVYHPGFLRRDADGERVVDKATVVISDY